MTSRRKVGIVVALVVAIACSTAFVVMSRRGGSEQVKIEIRARPVATIRFKGKNLGHTPLTMQLPRTPTELTLEATFRTTKLNPVLKKTRTEIRTLVKRFVPDADQSLDFDVADATLDRVEDN